MIVCIESENERPSDLHMSGNDTTDVLTGRSDLSTVSLLTHNGK